MVGVILLIIFFPFYGWFEGKIVKINPNAESGRIYLVKYEDGDEEHMTEDEIKKSQKRMKELALGKKVSCL